MFEVIETLVDFQSIIQNHNRRRVCTLQKLCDLILAILNLIVLQRVFRRLPLHHLEFSLKHRVFPLQSLNNYRRIHWLVPLHRVFYQRHSRCKPASRNTLIQIVFLSRYRSHHPRLAVPSQRVPQNQSHKRVPIRHMHVLPSHSFIQTNYHVLQVMQR